jgi:KDO2-lipid IV(A) lauroyltransferase
VRKGSPLRIALEDRAAGAMGAIARVLPRRATLALGRSLGRLLAATDRRHVAIATENLRRAFPSWDEATIRRTADGVYAHFGAVLLDLFWLKGRTREELEQVVELQGAEHLRNAEAAGRGLLFPTAHFGNWEIGGIAHAALLRPMHVLARPLDNPRLDRRLSALRTQSGNAIIYKRQAISSVLRVLRSNGVVALLIDQNVVEAEGVFVEFFGRPACTTPVVAALHLKTRCAVVPSRAVLLPDGRYRVICGPPLEWQATADRKADLVGITQELTRRVEGWVRETPEQWLWMHRRWKTQPRAESVAAGEVAVP